MIWAAGAEYFRERKQQRKQKPRPTGRIKNIWHTFVNVAFYCILNDSTTDGEVPNEVIENVPPSRQASNSSTRSILTGQIAHANTSNHGLRTSWRKHRPSVSSSTSSSVFSAKRRTSNEDAKAFNTTADKDESAKNLNRRLPSSAELVSSHVPSTCSVEELEIVEDMKSVDCASRDSAFSQTSSVSTQGKDALKLESKETCTFSSDVAQDMRSSKGLDDHIREVHGGSMPDVYKLIKRSLDWVMSTAAPAPIPSSADPSSDTYVLDECRPSIKEKDEEDLHRLHTKWNENIINVEVRLGLKKPKNDTKALAVQREFGNDTPYWMIDESRDTEASVLRSRDSDKDVDSGVASCDTSTVN